MGVCFLKLFDPSSGPHGIINSISVQCNEGNHVTGFLWINLHGHLVCQFSDPIQVSLSLEVIRVKEEFSDSHVRWHTVLDIEAGYASNGEVDDLDKAVVIHELPGLVLRKEGELTGSL